MTPEHQEDGRCDGRDMLAALKASGRVRDGRWIRGAPTHVLAEFLTELEKDGWQLVPASRVAALEEQLNVEHMELEARDVRIGELTDEVERLSAECARCESCGHVQGEPNWCHGCGRRTRFPEWASEREAEVAPLTARVEELGRDLDEARSVAGLALTFIPADRHEAFAERSRAMLGAAPTLEPQGEDGHGA